MFKPYCAVVVTLMFLLSGCGGNSNNTRDEDDLITLSTLEKSHGFVYPAQERVAPGTAVVFEIVPDIGYTIDTVSGCNGRLTGTRYRVSSLQSCAVDPAFVAEARRDVADKFALRQYIDGEYALDYHLYTPEVETDESAYPLILALHGSVEGLYIAENRLEDPHLVDDIGGNIGRPIATAWLQTPIINHYPAYVVAPRISFSDPQWYTPYQMQVFGRLIDELVANERVDPNRIYVVGHSVAGAVSWEMPAVITNRIAAILPMSGSTQLGENPANDVFTDEYPNLALWSFSHVRDNEGGVAAARSVAVAMSQNDMTMHVFGDLTDRAARKNAIQQLQQPKRHFSSELSYQCENNVAVCHHIAGIDTAAREPLFFSWLFKQRRLIPGAIPSLFINLDNTELSITWTLANSDMDDHHMRIWIRFDNHNDWQLLGKTNARAFSFQSALPRTGNVASARIRMTLEDGTERIYGIRTSQPLSL